MSEQLEIHKGLYENGFAPVEIDMELSDLSEAMQSYLAFLRSDKSYHQATSFNSSDRGDGNFGQFERVAGTEGPRGIIPDNKDAFHFGVNTRQKVESRTSGRLSSEVRQFLDNAEEIFWAAQRAKKRAIEELDWLKTGLIELLSPEDETINDVLRFIAYHENEGALAQGHFDKGVCTLAIGESHEGLRLAQGQNGLVVDVDERYMAELEQSLQPVEHSNREAKFFLGAGWNRLPEKYRLGNHDLQLGYHDVIPSEKQVSDEIMRWAIVMFCNPYLEFNEYVVPTPPETRPYKQLGRIAI